VRNSLSEGQQATPGGQREAVGWGLVLFVLFCFVLYCAFLFSTQGLEPCRLLFDAVG
jgi:hypothetical protein